jgi:hypothetical protein
MARADLLALTDDGLVQLANAGLVKRGLRDLAEGNAPILSETADGAIEAHFADGVVTRLGAGKAPGDAACSCPASGMCRHRVALVLSYRQANGDAQPTAHVADWDPGALDMAALERALTPPARTELARLRAAPMMVRLTRAVPPSASLPMATVRFLAPNDAAYARCDCVAGAGCPHVVLAIEAFRMSAGAAEATLGAAGAVELAEALREACDAVLSRLLREGSTAGMAAHGPLIDRARALSEARGATWLVLALEALAGQISAYEQRSAVYDELEALALATEIYARPRATVPSALGLGEAMETAMAKTRLASLGARILARGRDVQASVALFDTDTGATMLLEKLFSPPPPDKRLSHEATLSRQMAPGLSLKGLARGQVLTSVAHRRADGTARLGSGARGKSTLMGRGALVEPPAPLLVTRLETLRADLTAQPPSFLLPRNRVQHLHVFDIEEVVGQMFDPGSQVWRAAVTLSNEGGRLHLRRSYDAGAPAALDVLAAAFSGVHGHLRQIAGQIWFVDGEIVCEPWSMTGDAFIVPDCDGAADGTHQTMTPPAGGGNGPAAARTFLAGALHSGARRRDGDFLRRGQGIARTMNDAGYSSTAERLTTWLADDDVASFGRVAVWLSALLER